VDNTAHLAWPDSLDDNTISGHLVAPDDAFHWHEDDQQFLSHDSVIDEAGRARRVPIPSAKQLWAAYGWAQEGVVYQPSWIVLIGPFIIPFVLD
jgi:hypothetical protein